MIAELPVFEAEGDFWGIPLCVMPMVILVVVCGIGGIIGAIVMRVEDAQLLKNNPRAYHNRYSNMRPTDPGTYT